MTEPTATVIIKLSEYKTWGKTVHRLESRLHKARHAYRVLRASFNQVVKERAELLSDRDFTNHQVQAAKLQIERNIKQLEPIYRENKRLKDELAFYEALHAEIGRVKIHGTITYKTVDGNYKTSDAGDIYSIYLQIMAARVASGL